MNPGYALKFCSFCGFNHPASPLFFERRKGSLGRCKKEAAAYLRQWRKPPPRDTEAPESERGMWKLAGSVKWSPALVKLERLTGAG